MPAKKSSKRKPANSPKTRISQFGIGGVTTVNRSDIKLASDMRTGTIDANVRVGVGTVQIKRLDMVKYQIISWPGSRSGMSEREVQNEKDLIQGKTLLTISVRI